MKDNIYGNRILILDFGSQYTQLIARRVRDLGVYCELCSWKITEEQMRKFDPNGIILSGGPESTTQDHSPQVSQYVFELGVPVLGICYGMQIMTMQLGGYVKPSKKCEFGYAQVKINIDSVLTRDIKDSLAVDGKPLLDVWMSYNDIVTVIPPDFVAIASTKTCPFAIIANETKKFYGVQFHPEVTHTCQGINILGRFVKEICDCKVLWTPESIIDDIVKWIHQQVGNEKVILGLSGGIDSFVSALLLQRAIGKNLTCIFIDNGLLRLNEVNHILNMFSHTHLNITCISAEDRFLLALKGKNDPEEKRKIIGLTFAQIFNEEASKLENIKWLAQGTIYPDIIESSVSITGKKHVIKSHHNVGGLPIKAINMKLLEPLKKLFKDEVRKIGIALGLPDKIVYRHPFPGPGLGIRIIGEIKKEYCNLLRYADAIFIEELKKADLYNKVSQAFAVFLPVRSVGVMGDCRKYSWVVSLRAIETIDFMTVNWAHLPHSFLNRVSNRIINEVSGISRVVYDISGKPPATIEWE